MKESLIYTTDLFKDSVTKELITALNKYYPPKAIVPTMSTAEIFYEAGIRSVISLLEKSVSK